MKDFTVAVDVGTGKAFRSWEGEKYRSFDATKVHQFRISMARNDRDARQRAEAIFRERRAGHEGVYR